MPEGMYVIDLRMTEAKTVQGQGMKQEMIGAYKDQ